MSSNQADRAVLCCFVVKSLLPCSPLCLLASYFWSIKMEHMNAEMLTTFFFPHRDIISLWKYPDKRQELWLPHVHSILFIATEMKWEHHSSRAAVYDCLFLCVEPLVGTTTGNIQLKNFSGSLFKTLTITAHRYQTSLFIPTAQRR